MSNAKFIAYYRVSTQKQGTSGLGLEAQKEAVRSFLNGSNWQIIEEVTEIESGKHKDRPALAHALSLCQLYNATLIIAKLDRLARNVNFISNLMESKVEFVAVDFPKANKLTVHILAAVAEHEAEMISNRTKAALAAARARGVKLGGDRCGIRRFAKKGGAASAAVRSANASKRNTRIRLAIYDIQSKGAKTLRQIAASLNGRGIPTPREKGQWSAMQVSRMLK